MDTLEGLYKSPILGYAHHRIILDEAGKPVDYEFLEVNHAFEKFMGLEKEDLLNRTVREVFAGIEKGEFDWIACYGKIALGGGEKHFEQYSEPLKKWYRVHAYSKQHLYFSVLCLDITSDYLIGEASKKYNEYHCGNVDYDYIAGQMQLVSGAKYVAINVFDENRDFTTMGLAGISPQLKKASSLLGFNISGKKWIHDPVREEKIKGQKTTFFKNLGALTGEVLPRTAVMAIEKMGNTGAVVIIKTTKDHFPLGDFTLLFEKGDGLQNQRAAETLADITGMLIDRINTEQKALESKAQFETLAANIPGIAFRCKNNADWTMLYLSSNVDALSGYAAEELLHKRSVSYGRLIVPEDRARVSGLIASAVKDNRPWEIEYRIRHKDGHIRWAFEKGRAVFDQESEITFLDGIILDITDKKQTEQALDQERRVLRTLIDTLPDSIYVKDTEGRKTLANRANCLNAGFDRQEDIIGKSDFEIWPEEIARTYFEDDQRVLKHGECVVNREEKLIKPDGEVKHQLTTKIPLYDQKGEITGLVGIGRDITGRKRAEEEIKKQLAEKELILKEVNHRIKNNFATVESLLQLQTQSSEHPETQSALQDALARVQSMRVLYDQLLISDEDERLSIKDYVESLADSIVASFPNSDRITVEKQIADFTLTSNRLFNIGVMINELLTNAMKYAFRGKETGKLVISVGKVESKVTLTVQDDGNGLPEGFDASQSQGFGLMLVTMLSQQLNGSFSMQDDNGTRCLLTIEV